MAANPSLVSSVSSPSPARTPASLRGLHSDAERKRQRHMHDLKIQIALVRALLDELEITVDRGGDGDGQQEQIIEELLRLSCQTLESVTGFMP